MLEVIKVLLISIFLTMNVLYSQEKQTNTEIIPYRLVPSSDIGYGCHLEIELIGLLDEVQSNERLLESIYRGIVNKEIGLIGWNESELRMNNKQYVLVKIQVPSPLEISRKESNE
jgi:hypothetical protein